MKDLVTPFALLALLSACGPSEEPALTPSGDPPVNRSATKATTAAVPAAVREVRCGCRIPEIGKCGNYVAVDGEWLEIGNPKDHGLGVMEWCGSRETVAAQVAGERVEGGILVSELDVQ